MEHITKNKRGLAPYQKYKQVSDGSRDAFYEKKIFRKLSNRFFGAGFTLIEIMVAIAIVGILAAVVLVSMQGFAGRARSAKALAQLSSAIPAMVSCWGNGNTVKASVSASPICRVSGTSGADIAGYGKWPSVGSGTDLSTYSYGGTIADKLNWFAYLDSGINDDNVRICCNSIMNSCKADVSGSNCDAITPSK